jgi:hypothetical protein
MLAALHNSIAATNFSQPWRLIHRLAPLATGMFAQLWKHDRALVPASGWYESKSTYDGAVAYLLGAFTDALWQKKMLSTLIIKVLGGGMFFACFL